MCCGRQSHSGCPIQCRSTAARAALGKVAREHRKIKIRDTVCAERRIVGDELRFNAIARIAGVHLPDIRAIGFHAVGRRRKCAGRQFDLVGLILADGHLPDELGPHNHGNAQCWIDGVHDGIGEEARSVEKS